MQASHAGQSQEGHFVQGLGLTSATTIVMGGMIGSGIFIVSADIARLVDSPALLLGAWIIAGIMTVIAALTYGELAAMMPQAGGQYVYLREALGPVWGFLYGWTLFLVIQTGTAAAVVVGFGKFLGVFFPSISSTNWILHIAHVPAIPLGPILLGNMDIGLNTQNLVAIIVVAILTTINVFGVKLGALVQNVFTFAKTAALLGLVGLGLFVARNAEAMTANFGDFWANATLGAQHAVQVGMDGGTVLVGTIAILAIAQVGSLFSSDAWNNVTFTAGEVRDPKRNLPLSLALGTGIVILLYVAANVVYLMTLPLRGDPAAADVIGRGIQYAAEDRVGTAVMEVMFGGVGETFMAVAILVSTFGCANGLLLSGARVYYAMARDGLFFGTVGHLHPVYNTPSRSLIVQGIWTAVLCLSGSYSQLLDYIVFAVLIFYILTVASVFVLRKKRPHAERPYRAFGYPVLPALYIIMALYIDLMLLLYKPQYTWPGLFLVLAGIPVYLFWKRSRPSLNSSSSS
ncbi:MAG: amino acid transporter [Bacteroidia bacterium]|nr:MAG: amino acid transporter [Bacteroidia bacterium]